MQLVGSMTHSFINEHVCVWKPGDKLGCDPQGTLSRSFTAGSLIGPEFTKEVRLSGQHLQESLVSTSPVPELWSTARWW